MKTLIKCAHILTMDDDYTEYDCADILVEGMKIAAIGPNLPVPEAAAKLEPYYREMY